MSQEQDAKRWRWFAANAVSVTFQYGPFNSCTQRVSLDADPEAASKLADRYVEEETKDAVFTVCGNISRTDF